MRGSLDCERDIDFFVGIIPAHAGLTTSVMASLYCWRDHPRACGAQKMPYFSRSCFWDHPRACGAHLVCPRNFVGQEGSSPRMRGSLCNCHICHSLLGIIPAHAGLTGTFLRDGRRAGDHPRACGAHSKTHRPNSFTVGSSPRMRGSLRQRGFGEYRRGIIPAHAGLTPAVSGSIFPARDHPRACGAHRFAMQS